MLTTIDRTKVYDMVEKNLIWLNQPRDKRMIRECGFLLMNLVLRQEGQVDNQQLKAQYLVNNNKANLMQGISNLLDEELNILD